MNGSATQAPRQAQRGVSLRQRILPYLLLITYSAFREFSWFSSPSSILSTPEGPYSSAAAEHQLNTHVGCNYFESPSMGKSWQNIKDPLLNSTYLPENNDRIDTGSTQEDENIVHEKMIEWTQHLMKFHTIERMRRALGHRPPSSSVFKVLSIIFDYNTTKVPLKILVTGGSVTAGHWCIDNPVGWNGGKGGAPFKECAWPSRLERHLRQLFFNDPNEPGVVVYNMAVGAVAVDVATMILEYGLLPNDLLSPDIVLLAHSPNDANSLNSEQLFYTHLNNAVQAARHLRACDDDLPLIGIIDDNVGMNNVSQAMETSARYFSISSWYQLLYINYGDTARHTLLRRYKENRTEPLLGGKFQVHGGMGFHISVGWTVVFNLMTLMLDACYDFVDSKQLSPSTAEEWKNDAKLSSLDNVPWRLSPSKHIAGFYRSSDTESVNKAWLENLESSEQHCQLQNSSENLEQLCTFAWMVNKLAGVMRPKDINRAMKPVMTSSFGWEPSGNFYSFPRLGYYASKENAYFYLKIPVTAPTIYFTVLSTVSYGPNFIDTNLRIEIKFELDNEPAVYNIDGYHDIHTSPIVPHKFKLPRVANQGEVIYFNATLTSGSYFKIAGLAFCKQ